MRPKSIYKMILEGDDIRWQTVIYELVRSRKVDPWNLDISVLTREYLKILRNLERLNFKLSGKVVLAAALLLKLKTRELGLDEFVQHTEGVYEEEEIEIVDQDEQEEEQAIMAVAGRYPQLISKVPSSRTRPVTVFELMSALKKAIHVQSNKESREEIRAEDSKPLKHQLRKIDIYKKMSRIYNKLQHISEDTKSNVIEFESLINADNANGKVWTFVPLLHLANERRIDLHQNLPFGKIFVELKSN